MVYWNVYRDTRCLGTVCEDNEELARCAALSKFGMSEDEYAKLDERGRAAARAFKILPGSDFEVQPA